MGFREIKVAINEFYGFLLPWYKKMSRSPKEFIIRPSLDLREDEELSVVLIPHREFISYQLLDDNPWLGDKNARSLGIIREQLAKETSERLDVELALLRDWFRLDRKDAFAVLLHEFIAFNEYITEKEGYYSIFSPEAWLACTDVSDSLIERTMLEPHWNMVDVLDFWEQKRTLICKGDFKPILESIYSGLTFLSIPPLDRTEHSPGRIPVFLEPEMVSLLENLQNLPSLSTQLGEVFETVKSLNAIEKNVKPLETEQYVFRCEGDYWTVVYEGKKHMIKNSKGMHYIHTLLKNPGREILARDLVQPFSSLEVPWNMGKKCDNDPDLPDYNSPWNDTGDVLDDVAIHSYKKRIHALEKKIIDGESHGQSEKVKNYREEKEKVEQILRANTGLRGRVVKAVLTMIAHVRWLPNLSNQRKIKYTK